MPEADDIGGRLDFIEAVRNGRVDEVRERLTIGAAALGAVDFDDLTALMWAAYLGRTDLVAMLLEAGADPNARNRHGRTALMYAAGQDRHEVIPLLLRAGAVVDVVDLAGKTAIDFAPTKTLRNASARLLRRAVLAAPRLGSRRGLLLGNLTRVPHRLRQRFADTLLVDEFEEWAYWPLSALLFAVLYPFGLVLGAAWLKDYEALRAALIVCGTAYALVQLLLTFPTCIQLLALFGRSGNYKSQQSWGEGALQINREESVDMTDAGFVSGLITHRTRELRRGQDAVSGAKSGRQEASRLHKVGSAINCLAIAALYIWIASSLSESVEKGLLVTFPCAVVIWLLVRRERRLRLRRLKAAQVRVDRVATTIGQLPESNEVGDSLLQARFGLYLRPFVTTNAIPLGRIDLETILAYSFAPIMPIVALGQPGEHIGAGRIQTTDDRWQHEISRMLDRAALILCIPSARPGTLWELEQLKARALLGKTVFIMPRNFMLDANSYQTFDWLYFSDEWGEAVRAAAGIGLCLPRFFRKGLLFKLRTDGRLASHAPLEPDRLLILEDLSHGGADGADGDGNGGNGGGGNGGGGGGGNGG